MKLIIQIPCYNEAGTLAVALAELPREVPGIDRVEWLIIDDGSSDATVEVARANGVDHIVRHHTNLGLARAFMTGLHTALGLGADIIVNTDADNQYRAADIPALVAPILEGRAQYVIGTRPISGIDHFSPVKKLLQKLGSCVVRKISGTCVEDAPSGFRALSRDAAMRMNVFNRYTYTLETIIQAGYKNLPIVCVPVRVNADLRPSRLVKSIPRYIQRSVFTMVRIFVVYRPFKFFFSIGMVFFLAGFLIGCRFLWRYLAGSGQGMMQSLILAAVLMLIGAVLGMLAFMADLLSVNRQLLEDIQYRQRKECYGRAGDGGGAEKC
ncbi:MAG: glycosyltransferase family 2 protein [Lentisphaeria bacterium]|nr:glycosyltransferase family 2 protein [Lentisphaeria bacterium]